MKYLLDINVLLAAIWADHPFYSTADAWLQGKSLVVCPISELGFLRISTNKKVIGVSMADAMEGLKIFLDETKSDRIADDLPALEVKAIGSAQVTDQYLAALADRHGCRLATFDRSIEHPAVELIATE